MQVVREHQFTALANLIGMPGWLTDERSLVPRGLGTTRRIGHPPAVESWAAGRTRVEVCDAIGRAGIPAGPVYTAPEVIADPHVEARHMIVEMPRSDDVDTTRCSFRATPSRCRACKRDPKRGCRG
jgi:crotonobetainyl-CoA:carnitine CoA-transferase CaiB-like acyl-CoA transferase